MSPQLETHHGSNQIHNHGDEQKYNGSSLACLCSAEGPADAIVEDWVGAEPSAGCVPHINNAWGTKKNKQVMTKSFYYVCTEC